MLSNGEILHIAMQQSAYDQNANEKDFLKTENIITSNLVNSKRKKYYKESISCNFVSYGNNVVASVKDEYRAIIQEYLNKYVCYHCFETPHIHHLDSKLEEYGEKVCFMAEYFLPDVNKLSRLTCDYALKVLTQDEFKELYVSEWSNALCEKRKELDMLCVGAYDKGKLVGLAGCSADAEEMWQIGVDVLPEYRKKGIGSAITSNLAIEILNRNKVPFYCCAWSNISSARNAIKCGFIPAWVELTIKPNKIIDEYNK